MNKLKAHLANVALSHSVFALPFAYMGAVLAAGGIPTSHQLFWITLAMIGARSAALALNNCIDLRYDKLQPRFAERPLVAGVLQPRETICFALFCLALFLFAAAQLSPLCLKLAPLAVVPLVVYPYMKRFSWTCHLVLGLALSLAPLGAWLAVRGAVTPAVLLLSLAVGIWIAGFDVVYGCQDVEFDTRHGLHSMPVRFGVKGAILLARLLHTVSIACLFLVGLLLHLHRIYFVGVLLATGVLLYQHHIVRPPDFSKVTQRYFLRNGLVSLWVFLFTLVSVLTG